MLIDDKKALLLCIGGAIATFNAIRILKSFYNANRSEWIPIGTVKHLWLYPIKSCRRKEVFSLYCGTLGPISGELSDREFLVVNARTGVFWTARQLPKMILIESAIDDGVLTVTTPDGRSAAAILDEVVVHARVIRATLFDKLQADGLDCGDAIADLLSAYLGEPDTRLIYYRPNLFNERPCITQQNWWNNPVPKRKDTIMYPDFSTYMITTEGSLNALNQQLDKKLTSVTFRGNIVVDHCAAWDEDKWSDIKIGDVELQCFAPCTRCVLTTIDPETGVRDPTNQPLKKLREFRLVPEGKMRAAHGDSPVFGVNAGLVKAGYIHRGQTVYARYKTSAF